MPEPSIPDRQQPANFPVIELQSVDSTNNYARKLVNEGLAQSGTLVFAHEQWAGRGQRGKSWQSEKDKSILASILLDPAPLPLLAQFQLSACTALACLLFFSKKAGNYVKIKWPNDLYWQDRKAGGILIENIVVGDQWKWAIAGIGININQKEFPEGIQNPVSLHQITGTFYDPLMLARELQSEFEKIWQQLNKGGFNDILEQYNHHLYKRAELVKFRKGSILFEAMVKNVNPSGNLIIQHGVEETLEAGQVEWVF